jgi:hypothetical protein
VDGNPLKTIRRAVIDRGTAGLLQYLADKYNEDVDGGIEEWAVKKKGKAKKGKVEEEEVKQVAKEEGQKKGKNLAAGQISKEHIHQLDDHISSIHHEHIEEDPFARSYGKASSNMYNDLGTAQQDDFFWKNHQTREKHGLPQTSEPAPEAKVKAPVPAPEAKVKPLVPAPETQVKAPAPVPEKIQPTVPSKNKKEIVEQLKVLDAEIKVLIDDIDNNFSLSKNDIKIKRKDLHKLQSKRNKLSSELAE